MKPKLQAGPAQNLIARYQICSDYLNNQTPEQWEILRSNVLTPKEKAAEELLEALKIIASDKIDERNGDEIREIAQAAIATVEGRIK